MKEFIEKLIARIMLESASCKVYKLINPNIEDIKEFNAYKKCIEIVNELAEEHNNDFCEWEADDKEIDVYYTKCGRAHIFVDGNPEENNHVFCPYCGKKLKVVE